MSLSHHCSWKIIKLDCRWGGDVYVHTQKCKCTLKSLARHQLLVITTREGSRRWVKQSDGAPNANLPLATGSWSTSSTPDWGKTQHLNPCVHSQAPQLPPGCFTCLPSVLRHRPWLTNQPVPCQDSHVPGSHLKRCLEEFLSPPTTAPPPPLTEIPHLAWKADVLPKGKETGLGGLCSEKMLSCCGVCCLLPGRDFWSRAVMIIHPSPLSAACSPGLPSW